MASLNNIFLIFLISNLFLFQLINCCIANNDKGCDNTRGTLNSCCPGLNCKTRFSGNTWCRPNNCVNKEGAACTNDHAFGCCAGLYCSSTTKKCVKCLQKGDKCDNTVINYKCCSGQCDTDNYSFKCL
ncbi:hypothetical protein ACQ4LE_000084 [Meloidogyne hapla]